MGGAVSETLHILASAPTVPPTPGAPVNPSAAASLCEHERHDHGEDRRERRRLLLGRALGRETLGSCSL